MYKPNGATIEFHAGGDADPRATCSTSEGAATAADRLNRATKYNDSRHYTQAARLIACAEDVDGFRWLDGDL